MDDFLTPDERETRQAVRALMRDFPPSSGGEGVEAAGELPGRLAGLEFGGRRGLFEALLVVEEIAARSPALAGRWLAGNGPWRPGGGSGPDDGQGPASGTAGPGADPAADPPSEARAAAELSWLTGAAGFLLEGCYASARRRGFFESTLMEFRAVQQDLGDGLTALDEVRLRAYRAALLFDGGRRNRGAAELAGALERARAAFHRVEAMGVRLCGEEWTRTALGGGPAASPEAGPAVKAGRRA